MNEKHKRFTYTYFAIVAFIVITSIFTKKDLISMNLIILLFSVVAVYYWFEIKKIKIGKDGIELELEKIREKAETAMASVVKGGLVTSNDIKSVFISVGTNSWVKLILARMMLRKGLTNLIPDHNLGLTPSLINLISKAKERNLISEKQHNELEKLRDVTFYAEWWAGEKPTESDWNWALANVERIINELYAT